MKCRNLLPKMHRGLKADVFTRAAPMIVAFAALAIAAPAFAQSSLDSSSPSDTGYALPPPDGGSLIEPATPNDTIPDEAASSADVPTEPSAAVKPVAAADDGSASATASSGWDRVGDVYSDTDGEDQSGQVLEVPQVVPSANSQPSDGADQTAQDGASEAPDQVSTADQVGSINEYQDELESASMGVYIVPGLARINPYGVGVFQSMQVRVNPVFVPRFGPGFGPMIPPRAIGLRRFPGGMNSGIWPTSPMFPRSSMRFSGGMFGRH